MKSSSSSSMCATILLWSAACAHAALVSLNTVGYLPRQSKQATVALASGSFAIVDKSNNREIFKGELKPFPGLAATNQLSQADFSAVTNSGVFVLKLSGAGESPEFFISDRLYEKPFALVTRAMYLWRCGTAVAATNGQQIFSHAICHTNDAWLDLVTKRHERKPSNGGWHDAGDYNKYVVNAGVTLGCMMRAWEDCAPKIKSIPLGIPQPSSLAEFLEEVKWELDWLLTMQAEDGSVYHKLSTKAFGGMILPEKETTERFFSSPSTAATADFVAVMAQASRIFAVLDSNYAGHLLSAAERSYQYLLEHPRNLPADLTPFSTGPYQTYDEDDRIWAEAELWQTTGRQEILDDLQSRLAKEKAFFDTTWDWGNVKNLGLITWLLSDRPGRDPKLLESVRSSLTSTANGIVKTAREHPYRRSLGQSYYWGANGSIARQSLVLAVANKIAPDPAFKETVLDGLNHLLGRNVFGRSFVTGLGNKPPLFPHDRRSAADQVTEPWPGYLIGGPHPQASDWRDEEKDYQTNEIAINWNGALIYAIAAVLE